MTIDTSREAVERLLDGVTPGPWDACNDENATVRNCDELPVAYYVARANRPFIAASRDLVPALLAERDEYRDQIAELLPATNREAVEQRARAEAAEAERDAALAEVARLSHALAAETTKREAMEEALRSYEDQLCEGFCEDFPDRSFIDEKCKFDCAGCIARATLAKHGSKT